MNLEKAILIASTWGRMTARGETATVLTITDKCNTVEGAEVTPQEVDEVTDKMAELGLIEKNDKPVNKPLPYS